MTLIDLKEDIRDIASFLPNSVNCHVFCLLSSSLMTRVCSVTQPLFIISLIVLETLGGCNAHTSAIPGRVS